MSEVPEQEPITAEVVAAEPRAIEPVRPAGHVAVRAAAVAATTFVAGAGIAAFLRGARRGGGLRLRRRRRRDLPVLATRSFLVDVHLIDPRR